MNTGNFAFDFEIVQHILQKLGIFAQRVFVELGAQILFGNIIQQVE